MARRAYTEVFALSFFLCVVGVASNITQAWSPPCDMLCHEQNGALNELRESYDSCDGVKKCSCDFFKGCWSDLPVFAVSVASKLENPRSANLSPDAINARLVIGFPMGDNNMAATPVIGPPISLFLKNLSLLC